MTRFARAKGSKASNERVPEDATPWREMKKQLLEKNQQSEEVKKKKQADKQREDNYKSFLQEVDDEKTKNTKWAEFPTKKGLKKVETNNNEEIVKKKTKKRKLEVIESLEDSNVEKKKKKKFKKQKLDEAEVEVNEKEEKSEDKVEKKAKKRKIKKFDATEMKVENSQKTQNSESETAKNENQQKGGKSKFEKKKSPKAIGQKKIKKPMTKPENKPLTEEDLKKVEKKKQRKLRQLERRKLLKPTDPNVPNPQAPSKKSKAKQKPRRNPPQEKFYINGKEIDIEYVDGFPIKKEDAERIHLLRKQMISKSLPRSEIKIALKLERRKAEKAFTREKKKVCFNCRKSGHNLSDCPDLGKQLAESAGTGICFKCGSTEHTHFECKVVRGQEFKFAQCFICHEQGHIARQCPDNARGMYPKGGACKVCGDVTHLKKDCPKFQAQQRQFEQNVQIDTINNDDNPDILDKNEDVEIRQKKRVNKVVKF